MHVSQNGQPDTSPIERLIDNTRRVLRSSWVATGAGLTLGLLLGTMVAVALVDLLIPMWPIFRWLALALVLVPAGWAGYVGVFRPLARKLKAGFVARRIEKQLPGIHNRLVSCVDLQNEDKRARVSPAFYRKLVTEALDRIRSFNPKVVVDYLSLKRATIFAACSTAALLLAFVLFYDRLPTALARVFAPWADIPPASGVKYDVTVLVRRGDVQDGLLEEVEKKQGSFSALRGDPLVFSAEVLKGKPETLTLEAWPLEGGDPLYKGLVPQDAATWNYTLIGQEKSFAYRVRGGGTWTKRGVVTIVDRPRIVELRTRLYYPEYMGISEPKVGAPQVADVVGPIKSQVEVEVHAEGEVQTGVIQLVEPKLVSHELKERPEKVWFEADLPPGVKSVGTWELVQDHEGRKAHTEPTVAGEHQHYFVGDVHGLKVDPAAGLFAYVWIDPDHQPEAIALQWNDGSGWEHRAVWGQTSAISSGTKGTISRHEMGPLPAAGSWQRLEVPASAVGLEGATLRGMGFSLVGGKCYWSKSGTLGPSRIEREEMVAIGKPEQMRKLEDGVWSGRFTIAANGFYRVELRNSLDYANQTMKEGKIVAIPDNPPQIALDRPGTDITLNEPAKVPLVIAARDDFGLQEIVLQTRLNDADAPSELSLKKYSQAERGDNLLASLDVPSFNLVPGQVLRYRAAVRDSKGQTAETPEFIVRIASDEQAADKQLARFEQQEDTFREKLTKLIAEQEKISEKVEALQAKYEPLEEKVAAAEAARDKEAAQQPPESADNPANPAEAKPEKAPLQLDEETKKLLEELRTELAELAKQEEQNAQLGEQVAKDVQAMADEAAKQQLLPQPIIDQVQQVRQAFEEMALQPLKELANEFKQDAQVDPAEAPDVDQLAKDSEAVQQNLEALQDRIEALADAQQQMKQDPEEALAMLENALLEQNAELSAKDLANLRDLLAQQLEDLKRLAEGEEQVVETADKAPENLLAALENEQANLEQEAQAELDETREIQNMVKPEKLNKKDPQFPQAPYSPENDDELLVTPEEEDTAEDPADEDANAEMDEQDGAPEDAEQDEADDAEQDEDEELFLPALGGPKPVLDPRFKDKMRPVEKDPPRDEQAKDEQAKDNPPPKDGQEAPDANERRRDELADRGNEVLKKLDLASQAVEADKETLDKLLAQLKEALNPGEMPAEMADDQNADGEDSQDEAADETADMPPAQANNAPPGSQPPNGKPHAGMEESQDEPLSPLDLAKLMELMQLPEMQQALEMAARVREMRQAAKQAKNQNPQQPQQASQPSPSQTPKGNLTGTPAMGMAGELAKLDLETRTVIMKMPPRVREELIQGMREQGPAGYRKFIQDYFQRLTKAK
ncbi:MAG: hypothetical protein AB7O62_13995 [Pirellulales bacterium]